MTDPSRSLTRAEQFELQADILDFVLVEWLGSLESVGSGPIWS